MPASDSEWSPGRLYRWCTPAYDLADVVRENGALLLSVSPRANSTNSDPVVAVLLEMGRWLAVNGEATHGTRQWRVSGEDPTRIAEGSFSDIERELHRTQDIRFTTNGDALCATVLERPEREVVVQSPSTDLRLHTRGAAEVHILGQFAAFHWSRDASGLRVLIFA